MERHLPREETARVLALAAALWGCVVGIAAFDGAFERFDAASLAALAAFVSLFAAASYLLDPQLHGYAARWEPARTAALALAFLAALAVSLALGSAPFAMFLAPLGALASAAAAGGARLRRAAKPAAPAKSPGATRAAT